CCFFFFIFSFLSFCIFYLLLFSKRHGTFIHTSSSTRAPFPKNRSFPSLFLSFFPFLNFLSLTFV
ncbi:hypothetical protein HMI55_001427, partial [Coelomomyces lativittatus]